MEKKPTRTYIEVTPEVRRQLKIMAAMRGTTQRKLLEQALIQTYPELSEMMK